MKIPEANIAGLNGPQMPGADRSAGLEATVEVGKNRLPGTAATAGSPDRDAVLLSSFARVIQDLQEGSPAREARILELQQLVRSGQYRPDAEVTAARIIDDAIALR